MKQRDLMRKLFREHGDDERTLVRFYAQGERRGVVKRLKNEARL